MTKTTFSILNLTFRLISDSPLKIGDKEILLLNAYLPGIHLLPHSKRSRCAFEFHHLEATKQKFTAQNNVFTLHDRWRGKLPNDFYHLFYSIARMFLIRANLFPVHAACVIGKKGMLIVGHSGDGKTTTLLELIKRGDFTVFSGNKTIISFPRQKKIMAVAGTRSITIPRQNHTGLVDGQRMAFALPTNHYIKEQSVSIRTIVIIKLNDGAEEKEKLTPLSSLHRLYPYFLDAVNADTLIFDGREMVSGEISVKNKKYLAASLHHRLARMPVYKLTGSLSFIVNTIASL